MFANRNPMKNSVSTTLNKTGINGPPHTIDCFFIFASTSLLHLQSPKSDCLLGYGGYSCIQPRIKVKPTTNIVILYKAYSSLNMYICGHFGIKKRLYEVIKYLDLSARNKTMTYLTVF